jgi:hypothetical protein
MQWISIACAVHSLHGDVTVGRASAPSSALLKLMNARLPAIAPPPFCAVGTLTLWNPGMRLAVLVSSARTASHVCPSNCPWATTAFSFSAGRRLPEAKTCLSRSSRLIRGLRLIAHAPSEKIRNHTHSNIFSRQRAHRCSGDRSGLNWLERKSLQNSLMPASLETCLQGSIAGTCYHSNCNVERVDNRGSVALWRTKHFRKSLGCARTQQRSQCALPEAHPAQ